MPQTAHFEKSSHRSVTFKDNFSAYIPRWIPKHGKIADSQQILFGCFDKRWILERLCFVQSC